MWTDVGASAFRLLANVAGALTAGGAVFTAFVMPGPASGAVSPAALAALRPVRWAANVWAVAAGAMVLLSPTQPTAWLITLALAAAVALAAWTLVSWRAVALMSVVAVAALLPPVVVGHVAVGAWHDVATNSIVWHVTAAAVWTGSVAALISWARRGEPSPLVLRRYRRLSLVCAVVTLFSGGISGFLLTGPDGLTSGYGVLLLVKIAATAALLAIVAWARSHWGATTAVRIAGVELALLAAATALSVGLAQLTPPTFFWRITSTQNTILGYELPDPPSLAGLLLHWRPDLLFGVVAVLAVVAYLAGMRRLHGRGDAWPRGRMFAWITGWSLILVSTSSGLAVHAPGSFSLHMVVHMLLNMLAPALLAVAGPVTLALRALPATGKDGPAAARAWLVAALHAPVTRFGAHPLVAFVVFVGSYYLLYFTGLFPAAMQQHWARQLMNVHFVLTGYLYYWVVVGVDPAPRPLPHAAKLGVLFAASPFHVTFAVLVLNAQDVLGERFYQALGLTWQTDPLADQRLGGGIAWAGGELPLLVTVLLLLVQWSRHDDRLERRRARTGIGGLDDNHHALLETLATRKVLP
ncbi:cytochrome c oxidase assembly protein [Saccharopolyspora sp. 5N708]|uniref:cytochrome c oxidase assembly protein n=1 Tax=Saccharopolyspora sp. 5N708 TaxID=3457424 RepID=UPI003FCFE216